MWALLIFVHTLVLLMIRAQPVLGDLLSFSKVRITGSFDGARPWWSIVTHVCAEPSLGSFLLNMLAIWWLGRDIEMERGKLTLGMVFGAGIILPPLLALILPFTDASYFAGAGIPCAALLAAWAALRGAMPIFTEQLKVIHVAGVLIGIQILQYTGRQNFAAVAGLLAAAAAGWYLIKGIRIPEATGRQVPREKREAGRPQQRESSLRPKVKLSPEIIDVQRVDDLLEKISRQGMASLTDEEKRRLDRASETLRRIEERSKLK